MSAALKMEPIALAPGFRSNPGFIPSAARGKRVIVQLANGTIHGREQVNSTSPLGWAADTSSWRHTGSPFDIAGYRVL